MQIVKYGIAAVAFIISCHAWALTPEGEAAKLWGHHFGANIGVLLNPPIGAVSSEVKQAEGLIGSIVQNLAGEDFAKRRATVVVTIYANSSPNAFATETEFPRGLRNYKGQLFRVKEGDKKVYEIGVTTGLLNAVDSIDELAFILSHEIAHLLEGHTKQIEKTGSKWTDAKNEAKQWWSSQQLEVVADYLGIQRMAGKYSLQASIRILEKLLKVGADPKSQGAHMQAAFSDHHHEGPRIAAAQASVEQLQRADIKNQVHTSLEIPAYVRLKNRTRLNIPEGRSEYFDQNKKVFMDWLSTGAITYKRNIKKMYVEHPMEGFRWPTELKEFGSYGNEISRKQLAEALMEGMKILDQSQRSGHQKISEFILLQMYLMEMSSIEKKTSPWAELSVENIRSIKVFLTKHTEGKNGWSGSRFLKETLSVLDLTSVGNFLYKFSSSFIEDATGLQQKIMADVTKVKSHSWNDFWKSYVNAYIYPKENTFVTSHLLSLIHVLVNRVKGEAGLGPLAPTLEKITLDLISSVPASVLSRNMPQEGYSRGRMDFYMLLETIKRAAATKTADSNVIFAQKLEQVLSPFSQDYVLWRDYNMQYLFEKNNPLDIERSSNIIESFLSSLKVFPLSEESFLNLRKSFLQIADYYNHEGLLTLRTSAFISENILKHLSPLLQDKKLSAEQKYNVFRLIAITTEGEYSRIPEDLSKQVRESMYSYLKELGVDGIRKHMNLDYLPLAKYYQHILSEYYSVQSTEENYLQLIKKIIDDKTLKEGVSDRLLTSKSRYKDLTMQGAYEIYGNSRLSILTLLAMNSDRGLEVLQSFSARQFDEFVSDYLKIRTNSLILKNFWSDSFSYKVTKNIPGNVEVAMLFLMNLVKLDSQIHSLKEWQAIYSRILEINVLSIDRNGMLRKQLQEKLTNRLRSLTGTESYVWLKNKDIFRLLDGEFISSKLMSYIKENVDLKNIEAMKMKVAEFDRRFRLQKEHPEIYLSLQNDLSVSANLQPQNLRIVFPEAKKKNGSATKQSSGFQSEIRGLSYMVGRIQQQSREEQLSFLEYISGRTEQLPDFVLKRKNERIPLDTVATAARERLQRENRLFRIMTFNSFLAGPSSFLSQQDGEKFMIDYLLKDVRDENRGFAELMAKAILHAQGASKSLAVAYILGQPADKSYDVSAREGQILTSLFNAFGVPGIKLGQYLAFTSQLKGYTRAMESLQDSAMPVSYFEMLQLVQKRFGSDWPTHYRIVKIIGSGSVNIAIEYEDLRTGRSEVAQIARDNVEVAVNEDFRKFSLSLDFILKDPQYGSKMSFIKGLLGIIQQSVALEFNKKHVFDMQEFAMDLYNTTVRGWKVQTVKASEHKNMTVFMEKAPGRSARKVLAENPEAYREAIGVLADIEWNILMGVKVGAKSLQMPLFANPDFHDGQVLIDEVGRVVTILDFGQALPITNQERSIAIELVKIISLAQSKTTSLKVINMLLSTLQSQKLMTESELTQLLKSGDRMDIFIRLLADLQLRGYKVPLSAVHWVLALNRMLSLSQKIDTNKMASLKMLLTYEKLGLRLENYNWTRKAYDKIKVLFSYGKTDSSVMSCRSIFSN